MKAVVLPLLLSLAALSAQADSIVLTGTIRDFNAAGTTLAGVAGHPDFEAYGGDDRGIVASLLGADGKPVYSGGSHPTITSSASFYQWYHDDPSVNRTAALQITLNSIGGGLYQYSNTNFFPIDGQLLGQESCCGHNYGFTTEFHTQFSYLSGHNDTFSFSGDDDVFVFVNGHLALDLGGVHPQEDGSFNLDSIAAMAGLSDGGVYSLDVFQAERHTTGSDFTMTTSLVLATTPTDNPVPEPASPLLVLGALAALATARRAARR
jgi:fibro-slime domain-containing protein